MGYQKYQPIPQLQPYIESIWVQQDARDASQENFPLTTIVPTTRIDLLFFFGDPFIEHTGNAVFPLPRFYLLGQRTTPLKVAASGQTGIIIISFKTCAALPFFGIPMQEFTNQSILLENFMAPVEVRAIENQVMSVASAREKVMILQHFLSAKLQQPLFDPLMLQAAHLINHQFRSFNIKQVAAALGLGRRQFERRFQQSIGLSPRKFANILRFQKALFLQLQGEHWTDIVDICGYYDQSHFIREMKSLSSFSPGQVLAASGPPQLKSYFNYYHNMSQFYNTLYL